ncbi:hypothetical protein JCM14469_09670 [Desulfatiferula olefinivorans]
MADDRTLLATRIILRAILPVMKVVLSDDPAMKKRFESVTARVQFTAKNGTGSLGAALVFNRGELTIEQGVGEPADLTFSFGSPEKFNAFLAGKSVIPMIKGVKNIRLLARVVSLLLAMKILLPTARPRTPDKKRLKVKMILYMITTALSQYNKGGDPAMAAWTGKQPDRIYQMSVDKEDDMAAYLRVKAGKTKAGRGFYTRRRPFVHIRFAGVDDALPILLNDIAFVEAVGRNLVTIEGSPEYGANLNDFMQRIQALVV